MPKYTVTGGSVEVDLPPKSAKPSLLLTERMRSELEAIRAYRPRPPTSYTFYEVVDQWLGPWGKEGYPIGYGKYYNILFTESKQLMASDIGRTWVQKTTVCLQDALIELVATEFGKGKLGALTEPELREVAFESHVDCYIGAGLSRVLLEDPFLIPIVAAIPAAEFVPGSGNAAASWGQALEAGARAPAVALGWLVAVSMPAHSGVLRRAARMDMQRFTHEMTFATRLGQLKDSIEKGRFDNPDSLNEVIASLERTELPDAQDLQYVRSVLSAATARQGMLLERYRKEKERAPKEVREAIDKVLKSSRK
ncbi:MAG: hypothetical protein IT531_25355 [Burkholderiales bacterium]|nr:hypothetical protein [Burkholderiales bacterium]